MLWLQKTPNGKTGFRHTWGVKWSPSPGRIGQMVAVRLIMIACKMEALLLSSLTKRLSFPAMLFFLPLFYRFVYSCSLRWKQKCSVLFEIKSGMCLVQATKWESVVVASHNPFHLTCEEFILSSRGHELIEGSSHLLTAQLIAFSSITGKIQPGHIINWHQLATLPAHLLANSNTACLTAISIYLVN